MKIGDLVKVSNTSALNSSITDVDNMAEVVSSYKGIVIIDPPVAGVDAWGSSELEII